MTGLDSYNSGPHFAIVRDSRLERTHETKESQFDIRVEERSPMGSGFPRPESTGAHASRRVLTLDLKTCSLFTLFTTSMLLSLSFNCLICPLPPKLHWWISLTVERFDWGTLVAYPVGGPWLLGLMSSGGAVGSFIALWLVGQAKHIKRRGLVAYLSMILSCLGTMMLGFPFPHTLAAPVATLAMAMMGFGGLPSTPFGS